MACSSFLRLYLMPRLALYSQKTDIWWQWPDSTRLRQIWLIWMICIAVCAKTSAWSQGLEKDYRAAVTPWIQSPVSYSGELDSASRETWVFGVISTVRETWFFKQSGDGTVIREAGKSDEQCHIKEGTCETVTRNRFSSYFAIWGSLFKLRNWIFPTWKIRHPY